MNKFTCINKLFIKDVYKNFTRSFTNSNQGFCNYSQLKSHQDFDPCVTRVIQKCNHLIQQITRTSFTSNDSAMEILDAISNELCQIADLTNFCLYVHPDPTWQSASKNAITKLDAYFAKLNTNLDLFNATQNIINSTQLNAYEETKIVAESLYRDFIFGGIDKFGNVNTKIKEMCEIERRLCMQFESNVTNPSKSELSYLRTSSSDIETENFDKIYLDKNMYSKIVTRMSDEETRKIAYINHYMSLPSNLDILQQIIEIRHKRALKLNYNYYSEMNLEGSLAGSIDFVQKFLENQVEIAKGPALDDIKRLALIKGTDICAWDVTFYTNKAQENVLKSIKNELYQIYNIDYTIKRIFSFLKECLNLNFILEEIPEDFKWTSKITCYKLEDLNTNEILGYLYLDLFSRKGKFQANAHHTIRCGCKLNSSDDAYQKPIVALVTNFSNPILSFGELRTLLHEFGHIINSLLCRTKYQHLFGTRGPLDVAEIPSHFFENLVYYPEILQYLSTPDLNKKLKSISTFEKLLEANALIKNYEHHQQVLFALFDHKIFTQDPNINTSTNTYKDVIDEYGIIPYVEKTFKEAWSTHLTTYGASYYTYPLSNYIGKLICACLLKNDVMNKEGWNVVKEKMMKPGGAVVPRDYLYSLIGDHSLSLLNF